MWGLAPKLCPITVECTLQVHMTEVGESRAIIDRCIREWVHCTHANLELHMQYNIIICIYVYTLSPPPHMQCKLHK